jgi:hypothetical protein
MSNLGGGALDAQFIDNTLRLLDEDEGINIACGSDVSVCYNNRAHFGQDSQLFNFAVGGVHSDNCARRQMLGCLLSSAQLLAN